MILVLPFVMTNPDMTGIFCQLPSQLRKYVWKNYLILLTKREKFKMTLTFSVQRASQPRKHKFLTTITSPNVVKIK